MFAPRIASTFRRSIDIVSGIVTFSLYPLAAATKANAIQSKDEMLLETAHKLGIPTDGKTREQISEEISLKAKLLVAE